MWCFQLPLQFIFCLVFQIFLYIFWRSQELSDYSVTEVFIFYVYYILICKKINLFKIYDVFILPGNKNDLINFLIELNKKHPSIKSIYRIWKRKVTFVDKEVYVNSNKLYIKILKKNDKHSAILISDDLNH